MSPYDAVYFAIEELAVHHTRLQSAAVTNEDIEQANSLRVVIDNARKGFNELIDRREQNKISKSSQK